MQPNRVSPSGAFYGLYEVGPVTIDFPSIGSDNSNTQTIIAASLPSPILVTDRVVAVTADPTSFFPSQLVLTGAVSASPFGLSFVATNLTAGAIDPSAADFFAYLWRP